MTKVKEAFLYDFFSRAELEFLMALPKDEEIQHDFSNAFEEKMKNVMMRREKKSFFLVLFTLEAETLFWEG